VAGYRETVSTEQTFALDRSSRYFEHYASRCHVANRRSRLFCRRRKGFGRLVRAVSPVSGTNLSGNGESLYKSSDLDTIIAAVGCDLLVCCAAEKLAESTKLAKSATLPAAAPQPTSASGLNLPY
jgi:hypothetical protein